MRDPLIWPGVQQLVYSWLKTRVRLGVTGYTETDAESEVPRYVVEQTGGASDGLDREVDIELTAITGDLDSLRALSTRLAAAMWALAVSGLVDEVRERFAFADDPHPNPSLRQARATFTVVVRPVA